MEFPSVIREKVEQMLEGVPQKTLREVASALSERYREQTGHGKRLLSEETEAAVYAAVRMPATFGAVSRALEWTKECIDGQDGTVTLLDVGAGTGAASLAFSAHFEDAEITCLEREGAMRGIGEKLLPEAVWVSGDLTKNAELPKVDWVLASYVLGEMTPEQRSAAAKRLWKAAGKVLLIVEPGTPTAYRQMMELRSLLVGEGAQLAAPCAHEDPCRITGEDWCHFTVRVSRNRLHKQLKDGEAPYEDEKFTYMAFVRETPKRTEGRILRHPEIGKGQVALRVCAAEENKTVTLRKRDGELYKQARKLSQGDGI